jgi:hypothetical protein
MPLAAARRRTVPPSCAGIPHKVSPPPGASKAPPAQAGPEEVTTTPDVSGLSLEEAVKIISGAGFAAAAIETETSRKAPETAIRTNPTAGAPAKPGAHVTLTMSGAPTTVAKSSAASATASPSAGYAS